jgi:hypothetical protein
MFNEYLKMKDLRRDALRERNFSLAEEYLRAMKNIFNNLTLEEREASYLY